MQFMFRVAGMVSAGSIIATFTPLSWMTDKSFAPFRKWWGSQFSLAGGFIGRSKEFSGASGDWPFVFTIWRTGGQWDGEFGTQFAVYDRNANDDLVFIGKKVVAPARAPLNDWVDRPAQTAIRPPMKNAFDVADKKVKCDTSTLDAVGYIVSPSNDVKGGGGVSLLPEPDANGNGWVMTPYNFAASMMAFALRKLAPKDWHRANDEFEAPNTTATDYQAFQHDCVAWALFHPSNHSSSIGSVTYKNQLFEVKNHLFWIDKDRLGSVGFSQALVDAADSDHERFAALWLKQSALSQDANSVVALATDVITEANAFRDQTDPKFKFNDRWDAGWHQMTVSVHDHKAGKENPRFSLAYDRFERSWLALGRRLAGYVTSLGVLRAM